MYGLFVYFYMLIRYYMYIILLDVGKIRMLHYNIEASRTLGDLRVMWLFVSALDWFVKKLYSFIIFLV